MEIVGFTQIEQQNWLHKSLLKALDENNDDHLYELVVYGADLMPSYSYIRKLYNYTKSNSARKIIKYYSIFLTTSEKQILKSPDTLSFPSDLVEKMRSEAGLRNSTSLN